MNTYKKYCPNVFVAQCEEEYNKGDIITVTTKRGNEHEHIVHNFVGYTGTKEGPLFCYSITRSDGFNSQERAKAKAARINEWALSRDRKSNEAYKASNKDSAFLSLGEPIKVGHHSEKRHRKAFENANKNMRKSVEHSDKAEEHRRRAEHWDAMANKVNLSMPESIEFFEQQLEHAVEYHKGLKEGTIERGHSFSLTYAKKKCNDLEKKVKTAKTLWG